MPGWVKHAIAHLRSNAMYSVATWLSPADYHVFDFCAGELADVLENHCATGGTERSRLQQENEQLRKALRNVRLSAAAARTFGHSGNVVPEKQIERKNDRLDHILRFCADAGETGSILRSGYDPGSHEWTLEMTNRVTAAESSLASLRSTLAQVRKSADWWREKWGNYADGATINPRGLMPVGALIQALNEHDKWIAELALVTREDGKQEP